MFRLFLTDYKDLLLKGFSLFPDVLLLFRVLSSSFCRLVAAGIFSLSFASSGSYEVFGVPMVSIRVEYAKF